MSESTKDAMIAAAERLEQEAFERGKAIGFKLGWDACADAASKALERAVSQPENLENDKGATPGKQHPGDVSLETLLKLATSDFAEDLLELHTMYWVPSDANCTERSDDVIDELELGGRLHTLLKDEGIHVVRDIVSKSIGDISKLIHFDATMLKELHVKMGQFGYRAVKHEQTPDSR